MIKKRGNVRRGWLRRLLLLLSLLFFGIGASVVVRTLLLKARQVAPSAAESPELNTNFTDHLAAAIRIPTVSYEDPSKFPAEAFLALHDHLRNAFPLSHGALEREVVNQLSLLYRWQGSDPNLSPILLMAHMDVVPPEESSLAQWRYPPFSGAVSDGCIWGRGAIDDKVNVVGILNSIELLVAAGFKPKRTVYLAFGHDEELSGEAGAKAIAQTLKSRGINLSFVLDEGMFILTGAMPGVAAPVAFIGVAEKGYADIELSVPSEGGHSSMPPANSAAVRLSRALVRIEEHPSHAQIDGAVAEMFHFVTPEMAMPLRALFANRWLFDPLIISQLGGAPTTNALIRTTVVPTMLQGSDKSNTLPAVARAVLNLRLLPGDSVEAAKKRLTEIVDDPLVQVAVKPGANEPVPTSPVDTSYFAALASSIRTLYPEAVVAPSLMIGGTDSKHFAAVSDAIYRFSPLDLTEDDLAGFHGVNERLRIDTYKKLIQFYYLLLKNVAS